MKAKNIIPLLLLSFLAACSEKGQEEPIRPAGQAALQQVTFTAEEVSGYAVAVFRKAGGAFLYQQTLNTGWSADGRLTTELPVGDYKFLFAMNYGNQTLLSPEPLQNQTSFSDLRFTAQPVAGETNRFLPADELFLPERKADSVYHVYGTSTIKCTLKRAVSQVLLYVKRGQKKGEGIYEPLPYESGKNILASLSGIQLNLQQTGISADVNAVTTGQGTIITDFDISQPDTLTTEGFAVFKGPFFFPAENNGEVTADITLQANADSPQPTLTAQVKGSPARNQQLQIIVWVTRDWNFIGVTADLRPIEKEIKGEQDIWDDNVQPL